ncbi:TIGR02611 family protein [Streptomyces sp. NPDC006879]|uniref:TIGR02611 family protein n=1 Tax=Streptomyces sp. NPDC006879 TaxID=3364767 RepID=UPI0036850260
MNTGSDGRGDAAAMTAQGDGGVSGSRPTGVDGQSPGAPLASGDSRDDPPQEEREPAPLGSRAPDFIKARRTLHLSWQAGVFVVGLAVVAAGVSMLVLPGPGWVVIFAGMAIWATEFVWAQLVLRWAKRKVSAAAQRALDPEVRRRNVILTTVGLAITGALLGFYLWKYGLQMPWSIRN